MSTWYTRNFGDPMLADTALEELSATFQQAFADAGGPREMAVFTRLEAEGRLHCEVIAYFSPAAHEVAKAFEADPCDKPAQSGLGLLAGDLGSWLALFPEGRG
jgi:hypothetical protein